MSFIRRGKGCSQTAPALDYAASLFSHELPSCALPISAFELPESLIAHYPMPERSSCRLLSLDGPTGALTHGTFTDILDKLNPWRSAGV